MANIVSQSVFATAPLGVTGPDSITIGNGAVWEEYENNSSSHGLGGFSTIVEYSMSGAVEHTYQLAGTVDGLKIDPNTGIVWALHNQDANSGITLINPATGAVSPTLSYAPPYVYAPNNARGYDDVAFIGNKVYLSYANPKNSGLVNPPVIQELTNGETPFGPLTTINILSQGALGTNLATGQTGQLVPLSDPDALKAGPNGELLMSSENDRTLVIIKNPGTATQSESFIDLKAVLPAGSGFDDVIIPAAVAGTFYISNPGGNDVVKVAASHLNPQDAYASVGSEIVQIDLQTGAVTPFITGLSDSHGMAFVPYVAPPLPTTTVSTYVTAPAGLSSPDSITTVGTDVWAMYSDSTNPNVSKIVDYGYGGYVKHVYTLSGYTDGLKVDPTTGTVWALQNNDGNANLVLINPTTGAVSNTLTYAAPPYHYGADSTRGYDDVAFIASKVFLSYTNPVVAGDAVVQQLTNGEAPFGKLTVSNVLLFGATGTNLATGQTGQLIPLSDPDSLKSTPDGGLVLTSEADDTIVFIHNPGTAQQTNSFINLTGVAGVPAGSLDDVIVPTSSTGMFFVTNEHGNDILLIKASGLNTHDAYASVGTEIVQVDLKTGDVTPIVTGLSGSHGMSFVPSSAGMSMTAGMFDHTTTPAVTVLHGHA